MSRYADLSVLINQQEKELETIIEEYAAELEYGNEQFAVSSHLNFFYNFLKIVYWFIPLFQIMKIQALGFCTRLAEAQPLIIEGCLDGLVTVEMLPDLIPKPDF